MLDHLQFKLDSDLQLTLNLVLAVLMYGVALNLNPGDFKRVFKRPKAPLLGMLCQFLFLPALTCAMTIVLNVPASMALGMILVASCPGGSFSNLITYIARGNLATSVTMTATSSLAAIALTPLNFAFYTWLNPITRPLLIELSLSPWQILSLVTLVLLLPLLLGMWTGARFPRAALSVQPHFRRGALLLLFGLVLTAFSQNTELFHQHWQHFIGYVIAQNTLALLLGYLTARLFRLPTKDVRALTFEVGIQNSGLGLVLLFSFMPHMGSAIIIAAFWGIWHLISGTLLALLWNRQTQAGT